MRLRRFEIKNFKSIESLVLEWDDLLVLIGENNSGKSSVLSALTWFLSGSAIRDSLLFRRHATDAENAIELIGYFDQLTQREQEQTAIRGRMYNNEWILKKRYWLEARDGEGDDAERPGWKEQLFTYSAQDVFVDWPDPDNVWTVFPSSYQPLITQITNRAGRPNAAARDALRQLIRVNRPDLVSSGTPAWTPNPGGGGNWKSNANSIIPRVIYIRAVHEASDETNPKDASTYGKLINLIVERQLAQRSEMQTLKTALDAVLQLFRPDEEYPERQAEEIRTLQNRINEGLSEVIGGQALIKTEPPEIRTLVMPSTSLVIKDPLAQIETRVADQGHGLQRTLIITLLQLLAEAQTQNRMQGDDFSRSTVLVVEEPELYLHPQMERLMRDVLHRLADQPGMQVACCTHSPVFLDIVGKYRSIVRMVKQSNGDTTSKQVTTDLFPGPAHLAEKEKLQTVARFHPTINELFFAKQVVLLEEFSAIVAFDRAAELCGLFQRHKRLRREVSLVDCGGKGNITAFQRLLNAFGIPYRVVHDLDSRNLMAFADNARITAGLSPNVACCIYTIGPDNLESLLGYEVPKRSSKPFMAVQKIEELYNNGALPAPFIEAMNMVYFGQTVEPTDA
jgi:predicted ATP-dependent endonuclease of OLD family